MRTTVKLYALDYRQSHTYLTASIFVAGNIVLPQLFHLLAPGRNNLATDLFLHSGGRL